MIDTKNNSNSEAWRTPASTNRDVSEDARSLAFGLSPRPLAIAVPLRLAGISILIVDDLPANADALRQLLSLEGARVQIAGSAQEALVCTGAERFDVVITDVAMPGMSGHVLVAAMRASGPNAKTPAIAYTGYSEADNAGGAGFDRYLVKPATLDRFVETILGVCPPRTRG
jgi:CheY-like chemotaxis protein